MLEPADFPSLTAARRGAASTDGGIELPRDGIDLDALERSLVMQALTRTGGNQTRAGALLGLHRDQIRYRLEKYRKGGGTDGSSRGANAED
jgi:DNA-binding NtrC family response regulator